MDDSMMMDSAAMSIPLFVLLVLLWAGFAIGNGFLAHRPGHSVAAWVILSLIPVVNYFFYFFVAYAVVLGIIRRLNSIQAHLAAPTT